MRKKKERARNSEKGSQKDPGARPNRHHTSALADQRPSPQERFCNISSTLQLKLALSRHTLQRLQWWRQQLHNIRTLGRKSRALLSSANLAACHAAARCACASASHSKQVSDVCLAHDILGFCNVARNLLW